MKRASQRTVLQELLDLSEIDHDLRGSFTARAIDLVKRIRSESEPGVMELFLGEYGLSTDEGVALMCLAEALLRVPDGETMDALIEDKIAPSEWGRHLGQSNSPLVNASTWALFFTGKVLNTDEGSSVADVVHGAIKRLGEPLIRQAVTRVMRELGSQFVLGETIEAAMQRGEQNEARGYAYSYDMLGEAACTEADASRYLLAYSDAIGELASASQSADLRENPGISIKLSALHPRYESLQHAQVMDELVPRALSLATLAKSAGIGLNIDAEEAARLELSLAVIEALLRAPALRDWDGFGVVVQAYGQRAFYILDWLYQLAEEVDARIMVRLVKGAYWDSEIKHAQVEGHSGYPVFTDKAATDVSYLCCAQKLLGMTDRIYPQFATHNAQSVAAILEMADDHAAFEFQRLHGMGEALHETVLASHGVRCRIYAPVGTHKDLLAYLVRRLLENGANSSFVNQIVDESVPPEEVAADPFALVEELISQGDEVGLRRPDDLYLPDRPNSKGWDLEDPHQLMDLERHLAHFAERTWTAGNGLSGELVPITNPANGEEVGQVRFASAEDVQQAGANVRSWADADQNDRSRVLNLAADLYERHTHEIVALLMREAGKTLIDCIGELREAIDFLRYYASQAQSNDQAPSGVFTCISPWNFPLAIFTGQVSAALAVGNGVLAKPAEATPLIAEFAVSLMKQAGVPNDVLYLLPGTGSEVGSALTAHANVNGVCFTGSLATAQRINQSMAENLAPYAPLIAETGGLNAMIVDSTALPEQAIEDIVSSAFQSAGQRCSALRILYLQDDIADQFLHMLCGALDELRIGDPQAFTTDVGPVIDAAAKRKIDAHIAAADSQGRLLKQLSAPESGTFVGPAIITVDGIGALEEEIFGPVLHVARFDVADLDQVVDEINGKGYGLTFGLHSRIDDRVQYIIDRLRVGNIYINRNQIGAVVESQPFGGEGLSGTGPKAGGPRYLQRFLRDEIVATGRVSGAAVALEEVESMFASNEKNQSKAFATFEMKGPTGESNRLSLYPRGRVLCLGPSAADAEVQAKRARAYGCNALAVAQGDSLDGSMRLDDLGRIANLDVVVCWGEDMSEIRKALSRRPGRIVPLLAMEDFDRWLTIERHVCIDTTAAGGNAALMGS